MDYFQDGEEVKVLRGGVEVNVTVFRQAEEVVYAFDKSNRAYQFYVRDISPTIKSSPAPQEIRGDPACSVPGVEEE